jgi:hypothetical protein
MYIDYRSSQINLCSFVKKLSTKEMTQTKFTQRMNILKNEQTTMMTEAVQKGEICKGKG